MTIRFNDGMTFDTSGPARIVRKSDGLYLVGGGMLCPIDSYEEGRAMIDAEKARAAKSPVPMKDRTFKS